LNFDLLTPKSAAFVSDPQCITAVSWVQIRQVHSTIFIEHSVYCHVQAQQHVAVGPGNAHYSLGVIRRSHAAAMALALPRQRQQRCCRRWRCWCCGV